uniref:Extracellular solute-binding protein family 1 n=1 Tax=Cyanothece sp. (strain PCC 7425 / ATCC 29141) TaxID=395961 RepID=B8HWH1_CYAP4
MLKGIGIACLAAIALFPSACIQQEDKLPIVTIRLSGWQSSPYEKQILGELIKSFEQKNPGIKIKYETINSEYMDVIKTRLIGDVAPDVFYLDGSEAPLLMKYSVLQPLDNYITTDFNLNDFEPVLLNAFKYKGRLYGLPKDFSTLALIYNKKAFTLARITKPPQTWGELMAAAKKLTIDQNGDGKIDQYGLGITPELARQAFMIKAFGGQLVNQKGYADFASSHSLRGLSLVVDQYRRDRTSAQPTDVGATWGSEMLGQGKAAMVIDGPWSIPYLKQTFPKLEIGITEIPRVNHRPGTMAFTVAYVINRKSQHKTAAWKLIAYLTDKAGMRAWASQGLTLPARRSVLKALRYNQNPLYAPFVRGASYATLWQAGENLPTIQMNFNNQFISALLGEQPLATAMQKAQDTANQEIYWSN